MTEREKEREGEGEGEGERKRGGRERSERRIIATCYFLKKQFNLAVQYTFMGILFYIYIYLK
jgi:hypothetical protein